MPRKSCGISPIRTSSVSKGSWKSAATLPFVCCFCSGMSLNIVVCTPCTMQIMRYTGRHAAIRTSSVSKGFWKSAAKLSFVCCCCSGVSLIVVMCTRRPTVSCRSCGTLTTTLLSERALCPRASGSQQRHCRTGHTPTSQSLATCGTSR